MSEKYAKQIRKMANQTAAKKYAYERQFIYSLSRMSLINRIKFGFKIIFRRYL